MPLLKISARGNVGLLFPLNVALPLIVEKCQNESNIDELKMSLSVNLQIQLYTYHNTLPAYLKIKAGNNETKICKIFHNKLIPMPNFCNQNFNYSKQLSKTIT